MSFDKARFIADFERVNGKTNKGQTYSVPSVVQPRVATPEEIAQRQTYQQMQNMFAPSKQYETDLARITNEINAISGYGAGADRSRLQQLLQDKNALEQRLKAGRYDEDLTGLERVQLTGQSIAEGYNYTPDVLIDTAVQAYKDHSAYKGDAEYDATRKNLANVTQQINAMQYKINNGFGNQVDMSLYNNLLNEQARLNDIMNAKFRTPMNMEGDAVKGMQRAMQAQQQATYGMNNTAAFLYNTGASMAENAALMPLAMLPGGQAVVSGMMGAKAAAQKAVEVGESGGTAADALVRGLSSGAIEAATERLPLDALTDLIKGNVGKSIIKTMLKQAGLEAGEEGVAYMGNLLLDIAAKDPNAQFSLKELGASMLGGFISGGVMGGGATLIGRRNTTDAADTNAGNIATDINDGSNSVENAQNLSNNVEKLKEIPLNKHDLLRSIRKGEILGLNGLKLYENYKNNPEKAEKFLIHYYDGFTDSIPPLRKPDLPEAFDIWWAGKQDEHNVFQYLNPTIEQIKKNFDFVENSQSLPNNSTENVINSTENSTNKIEGKTENRFTSAENAPLTAENDIENAKIEDNKAESEKEQLKAEVAKIMGIDTRTEAEKVAQEQQSKVAMVQELANEGIATQEDVIKAQTDAQTKIEEANNRQINLDYQKIDTESGAVRTKAIKNGYSKVVERIEKFAAKRGLKVKFFEGDKYISGFEKDGTIYINVTDPKVMYKTAIHESLHALRTNNQAEFDALKKAVFEAGKVDKKLFMSGIKAELGYVNSKSESVQASIRNEDGTVNRDVVEEEVLAKMCEELIENPQAFVDKLNGDRTVVQAIIDFVKELIDSTYIEFSNSEKAQMKKAVREAEKALERYMQKEAGVLSEDKSTKFSVNDAEYLELAKNPEANETQLQNMVEEAAKKAGYAYKAYHGTIAENFTVFDRSKTSNVNDLGRGHYFTTDTSEAEAYAGKDGGNGDYDTKIEGRIFEIWSELGYSEEDMYDNEYIEEYNKIYDQVAEEFENNARVVPAYLKLDNPYIINEVSDGYDVDSAKLMRQGYDGIIDKSVSKKFGAPEGTQHIIVFDSEQIKSADPVTYDNNGNVIPLSKRFNKNNADIRFSVDTENNAENNVANKKITVGMTDSERADILKTKSIVAEVYEGQADKEIDERKAKLESNVASLIKTALVEIGEQFGVFTNYSIKDVELEIKFSRENLKESISKKDAARRGTSQKLSATEMAKLIPIFEATVKNAVAIETHANRYFYNDNILRFDNLVGGYVDGDNFVPIRYGLKHCKGEKPVLYIVIDQEKIPLNKIKAEVLGVPPSHKVTDIFPLSAYTIKITDFVPFVNGKDLLRYVPDDMLNTYQKKVKWEGVAETIARTNEKNDAHYEKYISKGNLNSAKVMVKNAAQYYGYTIEAWHGTRQTFTAFSKDKRGNNTRTELSKKWFFAGDKDTANSYYPYGVIKELQGVESADKMREELKGNLYHLYIKMENPLVVDVAGYDYATHRENADAFMEYVEQAEREGNDGIILYHVRDNQLKPSAEESTIYMFKEPSQAKSADVITYDDNDNIIPISQRFNEDEKDFRYSINTDDIQIPAEYEGKTLNEILDLLINKHGAIEQGEKPAREINVPKKSMDGKKVSKFARTVAEAEATPEDFARNNLLDMAAKGDLSHEVVTDKLALDRAESILRNKGWDEALDEWNALNKTDKAPNKYDIALGQMLYNEAVNNGDTELAQKLVCDLCVQATRAGQTVQAFRLLKKLTPEGKLYMLQKSLDQINREQLERYKSDYKDIEIPTELADKLLKAKDTQTADAAVEEIEQYIADQIPPTIADKFNAWRYLAMLGNPRTHIRNVVGNAMFSPFKAGKDIIGAQLEKAIVKDGVKTKAIVSKKSNPDLWAYAEKDFAQNESAIKGEAKYDGKNGIKEKQRVFDNKYLEKARKFNTDWLEKEDIAFLKNHYVRALAGAMKANGITAKTANNLENQKVMAAIKTYATNEAQKATYRDVNAFSKAVQNAKKALNKNSASSVFIEGILPFARTPANIIARGVEYSPVGVVRGAVNLATGGIDTTSVETTIASIKQALKGVKSGKYTTAEALDQLSAGLTGTAICALGYILASIGWAKGKEDDGGKEGDLEKLYGIQDYSLMIGNTSYTIDWAAPAAMPFFVGVELYNAFSDTEESSGIVSALLKITDPVFEMSMLDGINNAIQATAYTDTHPVIAMATSSVLNHAGQAVPTLAGQVARTGNRYRTQTYIDKNKKTPSTVQRFAQQQQAKIPGLNNQLTPFYDQWGRKQDNGSFVGRAVTNFASPGYVSTDKSTAVDDEVMRLYKETKDSTVLPAYADKKFSINGEYKHLTAKEYETFAKVKGQTSYKIIEELLNNPHYKVLDSDEQADAIAKAYSYAQAKAKEEVSDYTLSKQEKIIDKNPVYGVLGTTALKSAADAKGNNNGNVSQEEAKAYLDSRNFTVQQKALLFECMCSTAKTNPYK